MISKERNHYNKNLKNIIDLKTNFNFINDRYHIIIVQSDKKL